MKCTTKILIGTILATSAFVIGCVVFTKFRTPPLSGKMLIPQEELNINEADYKTIKIELSAPMAGKAVAGEIEFVQGYAKSKSRYMMPASITPFVKQTVHNDTLKLAIDGIGLLEQYGTHLNKYGTLEGINFTFSVDSVIDLSNNAGYFNVTLHQMEIPTVKIDSHGQTTIDSCNINTLSYSTPRGHFLAKNSKIETLNIDLDNCYSWKIDNCRIDTENLTGSKRNNIELPRSEARVMNWNPKDKDATLHLKLYGDSSTVTFR